MEKEYIDFMENTFLFSVLPAEKRLEAIRECDFEIKTFSKNENVYSDLSDEKKIGFVYTGEVLVTMGKKTVKKTQRGESFGILSLFSDSHYPTVIKSANSCVIIFINRAEIEKILYKYPQVALEVIKFLSGRILFLNQKINEYSAPSAVSKLACFLLGKDCGDGAVDIPNGRKFLAETLSLGRASLYRAIDTLERAGIIQCCGKKIIIKNKEHLEELSK